MKKFSSFLLLGLCLLLPGHSSADWWSRWLHGGFEVKRYVLPNGLTVLLHEDHFVPVVAVNIWYKVGSKNEAPGKSGFAHLFEHYMFEGSAHVGEDEYFKRIMGMGGNLNANTTQDRTDYFEVTPSQNLEEVLRMESDRMCCLDAAMNPASFEKQRKIVKDEKDQDEKQPYAGAMDAIDETVFENQHPYRRSVIGNEKDLDNAQLEDVKHFHAAYYVPNNAVLAISGDIDPKKTLEMVKNWFGKIAAGPTPPALTAFRTGPLNGQKQKTAVDDKVQVPLLLMAYRIPGAGRPGSNELSIVASLLGGGRTSRLVQDLEYDKRLVDGIEASVAGLQEEDLFIISAIPAANKTLPEIQQAIEADIAEIAREGVKKDEMQRLDAQFRTAELDAEQNANAIAEALVDSEVLRERIKAFKISGEKMRRAGFKSVKKAAETYLKPEEAAVIAIMPASGGKQ